MIIARLQTQSFIDFPDHIACIVYTQGCNMNCGYCHNPELIPDRLDAADPVLWEDVLAHLEKRKDLLNGLVFTGGEPTLHQDLHAKILQVRKLGYDVALHTNGTGPYFTKPVAALCSYILLSHSEPESFRIAKHAHHLDTSEVVWNTEEQAWENYITKVH